MHTTSSFENVGCIGPAKFMNESVYLFVLAKDNMS